MRWRVAVQAIEKPWTCSDDRYKKEVTLMGNSGAQKDQKSATFTVS
jgi:hypothetical protein